MGLAWRRQSSTNRARMVCHSAQFTSLLRGKIPLFMRGSQGQAVVLNLSGVGWPFVPRTRPECSEDYLPAMRPACRWPRCSKKSLMVVCDESVLPPSAETRLLKLDCRLPNVVSDAVAAGLVDEESLASDAASSSTRLCRLPP